MTTQLCTLHRVHPRRLTGGVNCSRHLRGLAVGNLKLVDRALQLGDLQGNEFTIVLRGVSADKDTVSAAVRAWAASGFVNYFGLQRFGTGLVPNHVVGIELLKNDWAAAVDKLIGVKPADSGENPVLTQARTYYANTKVRFFFTCARCEVDIEGSAASVGLGGRGDVAVLRV